MFKLLILLVVLVAAVAAQSPPPPPFLQGAPAAVIGQFNQLLKTISGKPEEQFDVEVRAFISRQSPQIQASFATFEAEHRAQAAAAHKQALAKFSPAARALDAQIKAIVENPRIPPQSKGAEIEKLINAAPSAVKKELESAMQG